MVFKKFYVSPYFYILPGDDLHTHISLGKRQVKHGTTITIEPLVPSLEEPIVIEVKPGQITRNGQQIIIPGRGWPNKKLYSTTSKKARGNLVVSIFVN
jgi:DnaJ-class molecular chaperone